MCKMVQINDELIRVCIFFLNLSKNTKYEQEYDNKSVPNLTVYLTSL